MSEKNRNEGRTSSELREDSLQQKRRARKRPEDSEASYHEADYQNRKKKKKKKGRARRVIKGIFITLLIAVIVAIIGVAVTVGMIIHNTEKIDPNNIYSFLSENSVMYDSNGEMLENVMSSELRTNLDYSEMPEQLVNAFVAIEDKTFWEHNGFNFVRILGAIWEGVTTKENIAGTSTITQQLARNVFLPESKSERSMVRKIEEAYYTIILERNLTKEQIIEAYLNTIYLGFNTYGVEAAAETYFGKPAGLLNLAECSALATIPKNPTKNALIKRYYSDQVDAANTNILAKQGEFTLVYNDAFKSRQAYVLKFMVEQNYITQAEADEAYAVNIMDCLNPPESMDSSSATSSYFTDYAKDEAISILMDELDLTQAEAQRKLYTGGLSIYTSLDTNIQGIVEAAYQESSNFPVATAFKKDSEGNAINSTGSIMLYSQSNFFESDGSFLVREGEYGFDDYGNLYLYKGNRLNFYAKKTDGQIVDIAINFKPMYSYEDSLLHISSGGTISVDAAYKTFDAENNLVIQKEFLDANPGVFVQSGSNLVVGADFFTLNDSVVQPQSAMVIMDQYTGQIVAMVGGRNIEGNQLYNRANSPRQPGSSIKPLSVYTQALLEGCTGATIIQDAPIDVDGKLWPKNSYKGYKGNITLRKAVQISSNAAAVRMSEFIGIDKSFEMLESMGITTLDEKDDKNVSAMGIGGMTHGLKPLESCGAYATIANGGTYYKPTTITKILDKNGGVIYEYKNTGTEAFDEGTAFLMTDILKSVVSGGTGSRAKIYSNNSTIPVAGKTGTTSNNYDAWFCGYTPYYTAVVWVGNDYNITLSNGSGAAAQLWSNVMKQVHEGLDAKSFEQPDTVASSGGEYYVIGREQPAGLKTGGSSYKICTESGLLARAGCPSTSTITDSSFTNKPTQKCNIHSDTPVDSTDTTDTEDPANTDPNNPPSEDPDANNGGQTTPTTPSTPTAPEQQPSTVPSTDPNAAPVVTNP